MIQPALDFFAERGWQPFPFQQRVWAAYLEGHSGLLHAPTGTGKTFAVWMGPVLDWMDGHTARGGPKTRADAAPLPVLWLTPLRALAADTRQSLQEVVDAFDLPWTVETRTSDTSSTVRSRQRSRLPTALITTPESLSVLLARDNAPAGFAHLRAVIVDEWHELLASKRGVQTELGLARLRRWHPDLRVWGLSATMGNLTEALHALLGTDGQGVLVEGEIAKSVIIDTIIPPTVERFPWAGHIGLKLLPDVIAAIEGVRTALVFCNTRSQVEQWYQAILDARPDWAGLFALHLGSIDYEKRAWVEDALRAGRLKCVVCTSSLDLGVDFPTVDRVFQVSSPKGVARLLQRAGRSGHQPGVQSRVTCVPSHAFELIEIAAARAAAESGRIEARRPLNKPLDVLVQHLVTVALGGGFDPDDLYAEVRTAHAYRELTPEEWVWALDFVVTGGAALRGYAHFRRVEPDSGRYTVTDDRIAQTHRMAIGTITSSGTLRVKFQRGKSFCYVDEALAARFKPGVRFALAGRVLEFIRLRELTVTVKLAQSGAKGLVPRWIGGRLPLSEDLTGTIR
ncbi:MAG: DEAD/DEAH box helicase, partial [Anaerolineae bacterium]